jgi:hypothetical protein
MIVVSPGRFSPIVTPGSLTNRRQSAADARSPCRLAQLHWLVAGFAAGSHRSEPIMSRSWPPNILT